MKKLKEEERSPIILVLSIFAMLILYFITVEYIVKPIQNRNQLSQYEYLYFDKTDIVDK